MPFYFLFHVIHESQHPNYFVFIHNSIAKNSLTGSFPSKILMLTKLVKLNLGKFWI